MKLALTTLMAGAAALALANSASAATAELTLRYAGSSTSSPSALAAAGYVTNQSGLAQNPNLTLVDLSDPTFRTTAWKHYFDIGVIFHPDTSTGGFPNEALRLVLVDVLMAGSAQGVTPQGVTGGTGQKYFGFTLSSVDLGGPVFGTNSDGGTAGDLLGISVINSNALMAADMQIGVGGLGNISGPSGSPQNVPVPVPTYFGRYGIQITGNAGGTLVAGGGPGQNFSYFINDNPGNASFDDQAFVTTEVGLVPSATFFIPAVPEPASLGVLAMGGLALMARRRRA